MGRYLRGLAVAGSLLLACAGGHPAIARLVEDPMHGKVHRMLAIVSDVVGDELDLMSAGTKRLGETLDTDKIEAHYDAGVLTLKIPIAEQAKPRRIEVTGGDKRQQIDA